jgi:hypothetical protein
MSEFKVGRDVTADEQYRAGPGVDFIDGPVRSLWHDYYVEVRPKPAVLQWRPNGDRAVSWAFTDNSGKSGDLTFEVWPHGLPLMPDGVYVTDRPGARYARDRLIAHLNATGFKP